MVERKPFPKHRRGLRIIFAASLLLLSAAVTEAIPLSEYHQHIKQAVSALNTLAQADETESATEFVERDVETVRQVRNLLPANETVVVRGATLNIDNSWLHQEFDKYAADTTATRSDSLLRITERLAAIDERIEELVKAAAVVDGSKADNNRKLAEILKRPEYAHKVQQQNLLNNLLDRFLRWLRTWLPKPKPISPGSAGVLSRIAQWLVIILALGILVFVLKMFLPRALTYRRPKKKQKEKARIVLGEKLEPDQSARDLLSEAEALARRGELRAAIRRAYIALLVELGERKIISLAQHKTNRDYLRAMRELEPLYGNVKQLTDSFELHWYGLAQADETDWQAFRSAYDQALAR
ncbi:MAG TPA: DUF4129 domain-containing protein [Pyrinomonadaceae bacterium]|nr:DUF4129 domain-containing protein [Pyrinomonadaceae bacterium]